MENDDDDDDDETIDSEHLVDENDRKKPDAKSKLDVRRRCRDNERLHSDYDFGTTSSRVEKACKNSICGLAQVLGQEEHERAQEHIKSSCGDVCIMK